MFLFEQFKIYIVMARKKVSEMTPYERVGRVMHGLSRAEVEEIGMKILGMCIARRMYALEEDEVKIVDDLFKGSVEKADEFRKDHFMDLAMMHVSEKMAREKEEGGKK